MRLALDVPSDDRSTGVDVGPLRALDVTAVYLDRRVDAVALVIVRLLVELGKRLNELLRLRHLRALWSSQRERGLASKY